MSEVRHREEVINTQLAIAISEAGYQAEAEVITPGKKMPDVLLNFRGLRVVIEAKIEASSAKTKVSNKAFERLRSGLGHISIAVVYPGWLNKIDTSEIKRRLQNTTLTYALLSETNESELFPEEKMQENLEWYAGNYKDILEALRRSQEELCKSNIIEKTARELRIQLERVSNNWLGNDGTCDSLSTILGISIPKKEKIEEAKKRRGMAARVAALAITNALIFQEQISKSKHRKIDPLTSLINESDLQGKLQDIWQYIWREIDYRAIFILGENILKALPSDGSTAEGLLLLLQEARQICTRRAALNHDLMGRIYHWLVHHAKYLATYYTSVSSATLLLKLVFAEKWDNDFDIKSLGNNFKVADFACGTGTLLMATSQALLDTYLNHCYKKGGKPTEVDFNNFHRISVEHVIYGYDVLPSAVHLTASTLGLLAPETSFSYMNLYSLPLGKDENDEGGQVSLGSLEFIDKESLIPNFSSDRPRAVKHGADKNDESSYEEVEVPQLDLCVMNPPFTRSVGGNLLFGNMPEKIRKDMRDELRKAVSKNFKKRANIQAGLGSVFVALAQKNLKPNGRLAFILPAALASGEAWSKTRNLISSTCHLEMVIASHDSNRQNFSENTNLSEVMFIARKRPDGEKIEDGCKTLFLNLWENPASIYPAISLSHMINKAREKLTMNPLLSSESIFNNDKKKNKIAELVSVKTPYSDTLSNANWTPALFAQSQLLEIFLKIEKKFLGLEKRMLEIPGQPARSLKLSSVTTLGDVGPDVAETSGAFEAILYNDSTPYAGFWNHESKKVFKIAQEPNCMLLPRKEPRKSADKIGNPGKIWNKSGDILVAERLGIGTHKLISVGFKKKVLGNSWWTLNLKNSNEKQKKCLLLWLNGSLAFLMYFGSRVITNKTWVKLKKPALERMPVLDINSLTEKQINMLAKSYDEICEETLDRLSHLHFDPTRKKIDDALSKALDLPDLQYLRELMAREPGISGTAIVPTP